MTAHRMKAVEERDTQGNQEGCEERGRNPITPVELGKKRKTTQKEGPSHQEIASTKEVPDLRGSWSQRSKIQLHWEQLAEDLGLPSS